MNNMKSWKELLPYIILNVIISAATTLAVLWGWSLFQRLSLRAAQEAEKQGAALDEQQPTLPPLPSSKQTVITIERVIGAEDIQNEVVVFKRVGEGELWLTGWKMKDEDGNEFTFPSLTLNQGGAVQVYTRTGVNTVIELFWGQKQAVWRSGEQVKLYDYKGKLRASYTIP